MVSGMVSGIGNTGLTQRSRPPPTGRGRGPGIPPVGGGRLRNVRPVFPMPVRTGTNRYESVRTGTKERSAWMPESCTHLYVHFVWATWDRAPLVTPAIERAIHSCIADECLQLR